MQKLIQSLAAAALLSASALAFAQDADASASAAVDINTASAAELRAVGFTRAQAAQIVSLAKQDPFDNVAELQAEVKSVGKKTLARIKGKVQVGTEVVGNAVGSAVGGAVGATTGLLGGVTGALGSAVGAGKADGATSASASGVVDINTATLQQLQGMGFSSSVAAAIAANAAQDRIDSIKELKAEVPDVTDAMLAKLSSSLEVGSDLVSVPGNALGAITGTVSGSIKLNGCINNPACQQ